jgi:peptidoglycan/LPS O-acetylase OafA/YrhL
LQLFFISAWGFDNGVSFNAPIWSVSVEIGIYILFFFLLAQLKKFKLWLAILLSIIFLSLDKLGLSDYTLFLECARLFFSGVIVYYIIKKIKFNMLLFFIPIFLIFLSFYGNFKTFLFCPALLLFFVFLENVIKKDTIKFLFKISGNLTYALYLLHFPIILSIIIIQEKFNLPDEMFLNKYFFFTFLGFLFITSYFCFNFFEKPLNYKIRSIFLTKK